MIRITTCADVPAMLAIYAPYVEKTTVSFEYPAPTPAEFAARFAQIAAQFPWLVWEEDGQLVEANVGQVVLFSRSYLTMVTGNGRIK